MSKKAKQNLLALTRATEADMMEFATPRSVDDTTSGSEFEERAGSAGEHGGYRSVRQSVRRIEKEQRRRLRTKTPDYKKINDV